ncbi:MAG: hypothetical protein LBN74_02070 [Prevotella sp.]|jgi:hypothetical protein|nr:hypothetical protein [Prevotella sp.]
MEINEMFYQTEVKKLNKPFKFTEEEIKNIFKKFSNVDEIPKDFSYEKRTNDTYFIHTLEKIMTEYKFQLPYKFDGEIRKKSKKSKKGYVVQGKDNLLREKDLCKELWYASSKYNPYDFDIIDIQTPLKVRLHNNPYGEIDLVGIKREEKRIIVYLIEAKPLSTKETLLRAVIESITYKYIILNNIEKFQNDLINYVRNGVDEIIQQKYSDINVKNIIIKSMILAPENLYEKDTFEIIEKYRNMIDFYNFTYTEDDLQFGSQDELNNIFKDNKYPIIANKHVIV